MAWQEESVRVVVRAEAWVVEEIDELRKQMELVDSEIKQPGKEQVGQVIKER
jgi:hypothetical protein